MRRNIRFLLVLISCACLFMLSGCSSSSHSFDITAPALASGGTIAAGSAPITFTANNDPTANDTITWTLTWTGGAVPAARRGAIPAVVNPTPCGTPVTSQGTTYTYTPPPATLPYACNVTLTATGTNVSATFKFTVSAITVTGLPTTTTTVNEGGTTGALTATINNNGVTNTDETLNWTASLGTASAICGTLTPTQTTTATASVTFAAAYPTPAGCSTVTVTATADENGAADSTTITVTPIAVTLPAATTVVEGASTPAGYLSAAILHNGSSDNTLHWTVTAGCGTLLNATTATNPGINTYTAPAPIPAGCNNAATVTATSDADPAAFASTAITITPITVSSISPAGPLTLAANSNQFLSAATNDSNGLEWTLTGCGSFSANSTMTAIHSASDGPVKFYAPNPPANCTALVTAASVTDASKVSAPVNITVDALTASITSPATSPVSALSGGAAVQFTATTNDPAGASALSWTSTPTAGCGSPTTGAGANFSYTPPAVLAQNVTCSTAVSVTDPNAPAGDTSATQSVTVNVTPAPIVVTITSPTSPASVGFAPATLKVTATITDDATSQGLNYVLSPGCGSFGGFTLVTSGATSTYTGTFTSASAACSATLAVASVANPAATATPLTINVVAGPTMTLTTTSAATFDANNPAQMTATLSNDPTSTGITLSYTPSNGSCGSVPATATTGTSFSYIAPSTLTSSCTFTVTAASTPDSTTVSAPLTFTVNPPLTLPAASPTPASLGSGTQGASYTGMLSTNGGSGPYTWATTVTPAGLTASTSGNPLSITGTAPSTGASFTVKASVTDGTGFTAGPITYTIPLTAYTTVSLSSTQPNLPGTEYLNQSYNGNITATSGVAPYTWTVTGLPSWLTSNSAVDTSSMLSITGTPLSSLPSPSSAQLQVQVQDGEGHTASNTYTINVSAAQPLAIGSFTVPQGMATMPYGTDILNDSNGNCNSNCNGPVTGGTPPYTFSYTNLPSWATTASDGSGNINSIIENLPGTPLPTAAGTTPVTLTVTDSSTPPQVASTTSPFNLTVVPVPDGSNNAKLTGQYACVIHQINDTATVVNGNNLYVGGIVAAFASNGAGVITGGEADVNDPSKGYQDAASIGGLAGSYSVGSDNRGYLKIGPSGQRGSTFALVGSTVYGGYYTELRLAEMDDVGPSPSEQHGGGVCYKQYSTTGTTTLNLNGEKVTGATVFLMNGESYQGQWATQIGSINAATSPATGVVDATEGASADLDIPYSGTFSSADSFGRVTFTCNTSPCYGSVIYLTNQKLGQSVMMTKAPHNVSGNDLVFGQGRAQNLAHIAAAEPINGPFVMYIAGLDDGGNYKASMDQGTGSSSAQSFTLNASVKSDNGTTTLNGDAGSVMAYSVDTATGRTTFVGKDGVFYLWDTNEAAVLIAGGSSPTENTSGWLETQVDPTANSGVWEFSDIAASYALGKQFTPADATNDSSDQSGEITISSTGSISSIAQDSGSSGDADWDEGVSGKGGGGGSATGVFAPDTTLDPTGKLGVFDINITQGGTTSTQVYCFVFSVDTVTNPNTYGGALCMDAGGNSPEITRVEQ